MTEPNPSTTTLPPNVHVSNHPCVRAKLSQLRSRAADARETKSLVHEIALLVGSDALAHSLTVQTSDVTGETPLGYTYKTETISPTRIALVPILRSGLAMVEALQSLLPVPSPIHHLGLFRDEVTLHPVEYYNNLSQHAPSAADLAIVVDPVIATGETAAAAIDTLRDWGVARVVVISVLGTEGGLERVAREWEGRGKVEIWVGGVDEGCDGRGMIRPGLGDIGDRLFLTIGK